MSPLLLVPFLDVAASEIARKESLAFLTIVYKIVDQVHLYLADE